jgi:acetyl-CoA carboxylase biotin carboxyl carrier protein
VSTAEHPADPATLDAVLTVLARHARELAPLGAVRLAAGSVTLEVGTPAAASSSGGAPALAPLAPLPVPTPHLTAVPSGGPLDEAAAAGSRSGPTVCSTTVGVFYRAAEPGAAPFVAEGDAVTVGQQIGIVEAMKLMIPLESDRAGTVVEILVGDGEAVEHGQPVLRLAAS